MPTKRCGCAGEICACTISAGDGVTVTGVGSKQNPYTISATSSLDVTKDGNLVEDGVVRINFTGAGVATSNVGTGLVTVDIPGGAAPGPGPTVSPIGAIILWPVATPPTGWLICNGQAIDSGLYPDLVALIGANTPNLRDRFPIGASPTKAIWPAASSMDGSANVALLPGNLPPHQHTIAHNHDLLFEAIDVGGAGGTGIRVVDIDNQTGAGATDYTAKTHGSNSVNSGPQGSGVSFNVMNPYLALNFIIKAVA